MKSGVLEAASPKSIHAADAEVDLELATLSGRLDLLLSVSPIETEVTFQRFANAGFEEPPEFRYRPLHSDVRGLRDRLARIPIEATRDARLRALFAALRSRIELELSLIEERNTPRFRKLSVEIYGGVSAALSTLARQVLDATQGIRDDSHDGNMPASAFAEEARRELEHYRAALGGVEGRVELRDDVSSLIVTRGQLLVPARATFPLNRVVALLQHEIGTHLVTYVNGGQQPLRVLQTGLPGHEELQEGLAVLAEYLVGQLSPYRLRLLAARIATVEVLLAGGDFCEAFEQLRRELGFEARAAFTIAMRVYRGGGLTKDVVYLRGVDQLLRCIAGGCPFERLFIGKFGFDQLEPLAELLDDRLLEPALLLPRYLTFPNVPPRLTEVRAGLSVLELLT